MRPSALICAVIMAVAMVRVWNVHAQADGLGERIIATGADLEVVILPTDASFISEIRLVVPSWTSGGICAETYGSA